MKARRGGKRPPTTCAPRSTGPDKENARRLAAEGQDRDGQSRGDGQSCGGFLSIDARRRSARQDDRRVQFGRDSLDPKARRRLPIPTSDALAKLHGPVLLVNGHETDFMMATSKATFDMIDNKPAFYGARHNAGHTATVFHPGGGEFANVASNWLQWQFKGDKKARRDVRRQETAPLHEFELGYKVQEDELNSRWSLVLGPWSHKDQARPLRRMAVVTA